jgi:hypothetical protein
MASTSRSRPVLVRMISATRGGEAGGIGLPYGSARADQAPQARCPLDASAERRLRFRLGQLIALLPLPAHPLIPQRYGADSRGQGARELRARCHPR